MTKTKLSTFLRSMMLVLFLVSWVSLKTIVKDGNVPVSTNGVKGKNKLRFLIPFTHSLNSADEEFKSEELSPGGSSSYYR